MIKNVDKNLYKLLLDNFPISCVDIVLENNEKFLLLKRKEKPAQGEYWFPGGRLYKGETLVDCIKRKLKEEVNIEEYELIEQIGAFETIFDDGPLETKSHTINVTYHVTTNVTKIEKNDAFFSDYIWASKNDPVITKHKYYNYINEILEFILLY